MKHWDPFNVDAWSDKVKVRFGDLATVGQSFTMPGSEIITERLAEVKRSVVVEDTTLNLKFGDKTILSKIFKHKQGGLFAKADIASGDFVGAYNGKVVNENFVARMDLETSRIIWDVRSASLEREVAQGNDALEVCVYGINGFGLMSRANHEKPGVANLKRVGGGLFFFANRDIKAGEEMTWPYDQDDEGWGSPEINFDIRDVMARAVGTIQTKLTQVGPGVASWLGTTPEAYAKFQSFDDPRILEHLEPSTRAPGE